MSHFPIMVQYADKLHPESVSIPSDIRMGIAFTVLHTSYMPAASQEYKEEMSLDNITLIAIPKINFTS